MLPQPPVVLPHAAARYVTLQRLETQSLGKSIHYTALGKVAYQIYEHLPFAKRMFQFYSSALEPRLRAGKILKDYSAIMHAEAANLVPHLPLQAQHILGIGAGVAGLEVALCRHYQNTQGTMPHVTLIDKTGLDSHIHFGFHQQAAVYNSLATAQQVLTRNGVPANQQTMVEAEDASAWAKNHIGQIDLVTSLIAWGFHFPVATYLELVTQVLAPHGRLIIDVRKQTSGAAELRAAFRHVSCILDDAKFERLLCHN